MATTIKPKPRTPNRKSDRGPRTNGRAPAASRQPKAPEGTGLHAIELKKYEKMWDEKFGADYRRMYRLRHAVFKIPEEKLNAMIKQISQLDQKNRSLTQLFKVFLKEYPLLVVDALPLLLGK